MYRQIRLGGESPVAEFAYLSVRLGASGLIIAGLLEIRRCRRFARQIIQAGGESCPNCTCSLAGLPDENECPECGEHYQIAAVRESWEPWLPDLVAATRKIPAFRCLLLWPPLKGPAAVLRRTRLVRFLASLVAGSGAVLLIALISVLWLDPARTQVPLVLLAVAGATFGVVFVASQITQITLLMRLAAADFECCPHCCYCLKGLPEQHECPECGEGYDMQAVHRKWREWFPSRGGR